VPRVLYCYPRLSSFIEIDRRLLAERFEVLDWCQPGRFANLARLLPLLLRSDAVVGWWASWHSFWPVTLAWLLRKPSALIVGGFDTASLPDVNWGFQQGGVRRFASRWVMRRATRLATNSHYLREEIERNIGFPPERVTVMHHGVPDRFGDAGPAERGHTALTVGYISDFNLTVKGLLPFVEAAALLPEVAFTLVGPAVDGSDELLRERAPANVTLTGWVDDDELAERYRTASVYVQPSRHEGFGMAVAEAMLAGCIPVVTHAGALPEVVGDAGVVVETPAPEVVADGVRRALAMPAAARQRARERALEHFSLEVRRRGLAGFVDDALAASRRPRERGSGGR
jgi:glycosyltransferase involved in cell wall biosynthesis